MPTQKILVVDDEEDLRSLYSDILADSGFEVDSAKDGVDAIEHIKSCSFSMVLSDVKMPNCNGVQLVEWVNQNRPGLKMLFISGFSDIPEVKRIAEMGYKKILPKPIKKEVLVNSIQDYLSNQTSTEFDPNNYGAIPIDDFIAGKDIKYTIYVRLNDDRFVKVSKEGENIDLERIQAFKSKGVTKLWLDKKDFNHYVSVSQKVVQVVAGNSAVNADKKSQLIQHACEVAYENLRLTGVTEENTKQTIEVFESAVGHIGSDISALSALEKMDAGEDVLYSHAVTCSVFCGLISKVMGWSSKKNVQALTLGGFFHDIGMNDMPHDLLKKDLDAMTEEEKKLFYSHPERGADLLKQIKTIPPEVVSIALQHHENVYGTGFPNKMLKSDIFPMARIVSLVDRFCDALLSINKKSKELSLALLSRIIDNDPSNCDPVASLALSIALQVDNMAEAQKTFQKQLQKLEKR